VKSELLAKSPMLALPLIALFLFMVVFAVIFVVTMKKRAPAYDPLARMPLDEDEDPPHAQMTRGARK
jgi:cbb3-type cytochrome oxidase subunit 3